MRFYELHESDGTTVETSGACAHCGQPNQQTDNVCGTHKMTGWRIWIVRFLFPDWRQFQKLPFDPTPGIT